MATEKLIVELDAKTAKLDTALKSTDKKLNKLDSSVKKTDKSFSNFTKGAAAAAIAITAVAVATAAAVKQAADFAKELTIASNRTGDSVEKLQAMAFATNTVGISLEKLGDIGKDANEKIGEFLVTGGGGFVDFVDIMKLTGQEAEKMAEQFSLMSGTDVLQAMVTQMEAAGISSNKMSFALEGLASDATDLIPLFKDNGAVIKTLTNEFNELNITLSKSDLNKIKEVGQEFEKFSAAFAGGTRQLIADYSKEIIRAIEITAVLASKTISGFGVITAGWGGLINVSQAALTDFVNGTKTFDQALMESSQNSMEAINEFLGVQFYDLGVNAGALMADGVADGFGENSDGILDIVVKGGTQLSSWEKLDKKQRIGVYKDFISASSTLSEQYLEDNKGIRSALVVMDTAAGITRAFAESNFWVALGQSAVIAASGLVQLSNINSAGKGGGTISTGTGGGAGSQAPQQEFTPETAGLEVTDATVDGSNAQTIRFAVDSGDDLIDAISKALNKAQDEGR